MPNSKRPEVRTRSTEGLLTIVRSGFHRNTLYIASAPESVEIPGAVVASSRTNNLGVPAQYNQQFPEASPSTCGHNESGGPAVLFNKLSVLSRSGNHISCPSLAVADRMRSSFTLRPSATERAESATGTYTVSAW